MEKMERLGRCLGRHTCVSCQSSLPFAAHPANHAPQLMVKPAWEFLLAGTYLD
jgi:hypothetical protein